MHATPASLRKAFIRISSENFGSLPLADHLLLHTLGW